MGRFTRISSDAFSALQLDAGVLLSQFDPLNPYVDPTDETIIATTSGGINPTCAAAYSDLAEDVDNAPNNLMEFKHLDGWDCAMAFTSIKFNATGVKLSLGAADVTTLENGVHKIKPRRDLQLSDFTDIWWVGDKADGGAAAICLKNALSDGGFSMQTTKNGKGTIAMTLKGHVSRNAQDDMPMEFYDIPPAAGDIQMPVTQILTHVTSNFDDDAVDYGDPLSVTLTAASNYTLSADGVTVTMGGVDITALAYNSSTKIVAIAEVTSAVVITATATAST